MRHLINHAETVALRKIGNPQGFTCCGWHILDDGSTLFKMRKEIPQPEGERRRWSDYGEKTACVNDAEVRAEEKRYEAETGLCHRCQGTKEQFHGWSIKEGTRYVPCRACQATGKASPCPEGQTLTEPTQPGKAS